MIRPSRLPVLVAAALLAASCQRSPVTAETAAGCIGREVNKVAEQVARLGAVVGLGEEIPTFSVSAITLGECRETNVGEHTCVVEYQLAAKGGGEAVNAFIAQLELLLGRKLSDTRQQRWAFTKGPSVTTCRLVP